MDIRLFARVIRRFRVLVVIGLLLAASLAFLSYFKVDSHGHVSYRGEEIWQAQARLLVIPRTTTSAAIPGPNTVAEAQVFSAAVNSDSVTRLTLENLRSSGGQLGSGGIHPPMGVVAEPAYNAQAQQSLPIIVVAATAGTQRDAALLANASANALSKYMVDQQRTTGVAPSQQVRTQWLNEALPQAAIVASPRSKTRPILVFVLVITAMLVLIMILENIRPRLREVSPEPVHIADRRKSESSSSSG